LQSLQAYTSTLGGGYFFCGQLHAAIELARYQRKLALALHDDHGAGICTVVSEKMTENLGSTLAFSAWHSFSPMLHVRTLNQLRYFIFLLIFFLAE
jgi:hypothetical protein